MAIIGTCLWNTPTEEFLFKKANHIQLPNICKNFGGSTQNLICSLFLHLPLLKRFRHGKVAPHFAIARYMVLCDTNRFSKCWIIFSHLLSVTEIIKMINHCISFVWNNDPMLRYFVLFLCQNCNSLMFC